MPKKLIKNNNGKDKIQPMPHTRNKVQWEEMNTNLLSHIVTAIKLDTIAIVVELVVTLFTPSKCK